MSGFYQLVLTRFPSTPLLPAPPPTSSACTYSLLSSVACRYTVYTLEGKLSVVWGYFTVLEEDLAKNLELVPHMNKK